MNDQIEKLKEKVQKDPASKLFVPLAEEYRKAGMYDEAIGVLEAGLSRQPGYMSARVALGKIFLEKGLRAEAQAEFERVVGVIPDNLYAQRKLADMYLEQGDTARARQAFQTVLDLHPRDEEARRILEELDSGALPAGTGPQGTEAQPEPAGVAVEAAAGQGEESEGEVKVDDELPELPDITLPEDFGTPGAAAEVEDLAVVAPPDELAATQEEGGEPFDIQELPGEQAGWASEPEESERRSVEEQEVEVGEASEEEGTGEAAAYEIPDDEEYDLSDLGVQMPERLSPTDQSSESEDLDEFRRAMGESHVQEREDTVEESPWAVVEEEPGDDVYAGVADVADGFEIPGETEAEGVRDALADADRLITQGEYEEAVGILRGALQQDPDDKRVVQRLEELTMLLSLVRKKASRENAAKHEMVIKGLETLLAGFRGRRSG